MIFCDILDYSEFLIAFVSKALRKKGHICVCFDMEFYTLNNELGLSQNQLLQPVLLAQECVKELFHGLERSSSFLAYLVMFEL